MNNDLYLDGKNNALRFSTFDKFEGETVFNHVAAKFVASGKETYFIKNKKFVVKKGEYIIGNNDVLSEVLIAEKTIGVCVDISNEVINEVAEHFFLNDDFKDFMCTDGFLINKYNIKNSLLGLKLNHLSDNLMRRNQLDDLLNSELFYSIGEAIVLDQSQIFEHYSKLNFRKIEVNDTNFLNLLNAKHLIDDCFLQALNIENLTDAANMSKFAFLRLFKTAFGISPYQYLLNKRLNYAKSLLEKGDPIHQIAFNIGYADTPTFSKAFKQNFGISPSKWQK